MLMLDVELLLIINDCRPETERLKTGDYPTEGIALFRFNINNNHAVIKGKAAKRVI